MLLALFAMVLLTTLIGVLAVTSRVRAVRAKQVSVKAFKTMEAEFPDAITRTTRSYNNQFELPVLFYTAGAIYLSLGHSHSLGVALAWCFVASRIAHAWVHLTSNNVLHRMLTFWLGVILVLAMWVSLLINHS